MKQQFEQVVSVKSNYYTQGSPVQFVKLELLRNSDSGEIAVCFTFQNVTESPLQDLVVRFKCRDSSGSVACEEEFCYEGTLEPGEKFGGSQAVYLTTRRLSKADVHLLHVRDASGHLMDLSACPRVRLPQQPVLSEELRARLCQKTHNPQLQYEPVVVDGGWLCGCGAFHAGDGVYCPACGADRILVQNMIDTLRRGQAEAPALDEQPTRMAGAASSAFVPEMDDQPTRMVDAPQPAGEYDEYEGEEEDGEYDEDEYDEETPEDRDARARAIICWAPVVTAVLCVITIGIGVLCCL